MDKLVSVIIPCYNAEKYIRDTIFSIIYQTYKNIEIICVDNGSSDNTVRIIEDISIEFPQIKILSQLKKGAPAARNLGLENAKGEVIQFLDSDDLLAPKKIESQLNFLIHNNYDIVVSDRVVLNSDLTQTIRNIKFPEITTYPLLVAVRDIIITGNPLYKRSLFEKFGNWDENLNSAQDWELNIRFFLQKIRIGYLQGDYLICRSHVESLSANWLNVSRSGIIVLNKLKKQLIESNVITDTNVQNKIFYCFFDVAIADNDTKSIKTAMDEFKIPIFAQLSGINKVIALFIGIGGIIRLKHFFQRKNN